MPTERASKRRRRLSPGRRGRLEGAVYAEAVMVVGTMTLLFFLIDFVHTGYAKAVTSATQTRGHGWNHVMEPCKGSVPSPTLQQSEGSWGVGSLGALAFVSDALSLGTQFQPLLATYTGMISFRIPQHRFSQVDSVTRPDALGGDARYGHQIVLSCNEDLDDLEMNSWKFGLWTYAAYERY